MTDSYLSEVLVGFGPNTRIQTQFNGIKLFKDIKLGYTLQDGSYVIGVLSFKNTSLIFNFKNNIYLHGNVKYKNIKIKDHKDSKMTFHQPDRIFHLITTTGRICIKDLIFNDFSISTNTFYNYTINSIILSFLNNDINSTELSYGPKFLAQGFSGETLISISPSIQKKLIDIKINDIINGDDPVVGIVRLSPDFFTFYKYNTIIVSDNTKILDDDNIWKSIEYMSCEKVSPPLNLLNIITKNGMLLCNGLIFMDFLEIRNEFIKKRIDEITYISIQDT